MKRQKYESLFLSEMDTTKLIQEKNAICRVPITWDNGKIAKFATYPLCIVLTCLALLCVITGHLIPFIIRIIFNGFLTEVVAEHLNELIPSAVTLHNWNIIFCQILMQPIWCMILRKY